MGVIISILISCCMLSVVVKAMEIRSKRIQIEQINEESKKKQGRKLPYRYADYLQEVHARASQEWTEAYKQANAEHAITVKESKQFELECKERIRRERELEKLENEIPKLKFNIEKYNSDIWHFTVLLEDLNMQFDEANIEAYDCHHRGDYANEKKKRTTINQLRRQIRSANNSLEKTKFDKEQAEKKLEEAIFLIGDVA